MSEHKGFFSILLFFIVLIPGCSKKNSIPSLKGPYLGQEPPGKTPEIFAPGIISTGASEFGSTFSPDGDAFYYAISGVPNTIACVKLKKNEWTKPQISPFSGQYSDWDMNLSPDGTKLYFTSNRPLAGDGPPIDNSNLWVVERTGEEWSDPKSLGSPINTDGYENYPSISRDGTLYFFHSTKENNQNPDVYYSAWIDGKYQEPVRLGNEINSEYPEWDPFIAADESFLIFSSVGRPEGYGECDLYISYKKSDGTWTDGTNMGATINSRAHEFCPNVTSDGKYFFFMSKRRRPDRKHTDAPLTYEQKMNLVYSWGNGEGDIYWVDAGIIEDLKPDHLK